MRSTVTAFHSNTRKQFRWTLVVWKSQCTGVRHSCSLRKKQLKARQCLYWLVKSEILHTGNYESLLKAVQLMGCKQLKYLNQGENAKYTSKRIIQEFMQVMAAKIEGQTLRNIINGNFSLIINESTDIAVCKELVMYACYLSPDATTCTAFLTITKLPNGTAETIKRSFLGDKVLSVDKMVRFGLNGASVMTERKSGVATRLLG